MLISVKKYTVEGILLTPLSNAVRHLGGSPRLMFEIIVLMIYFQFRFHRPVVIFISDFKCLYTMF